MAGVFAPPGARTRVDRWDGPRRESVSDALAVEEPLAVRVNDQPFTVTMRTPGDDLALVAGLLFAEGVIRSADDIALMVHCGSGEDADWANAVKVVLGDGRTVPLASARNLVSATSCGLCGKTTIDALRVDQEPLPNGPAIPAALLYALPEAMRARQEVFASTGGLHAAALFDADGQLVAVGEDVGRHNAVDKVIGRALTDRLVPLERHVLMVSGRLSYEIVQKAIAARVPVVAAISAPSTLAVELASAFNQTLVGFLRGERMNVYCGGDRILNGR